MSSFPSTLALNVTCLLSGENSCPRISHLSLVSHEIFLVAISSSPMLSYPFAAFDVSKTLLPSGAMSLAV